MAAVATEIAKEREAAKGLGTIDNPVKYKGQDYEKLKAQYLASGTLFTDPEFPAAPSSLGVNKLGPDSEDGKGIEWKRPSEISDDPVFTREGTSRDDIRQGQLGNCWLLASVASLTMNEDCLRRVIPRGQKFRSDYCGIFHFVIWQAGEWCEVVVDDLLPTKDGKLRFLKSDTSEYWSSLLEKGYAKLLGSYEALIGGSAAESLTDFTAGVAEVIYIKEEEQYLLEKIRSTLEEQSLVTCSTGALADPKEKSEVVRKHAYSLTGLEEVDHGGKKVQLIRVRNPWGYREGQGAWSDNAPEWDEIDPQVKDKLHSKKDDGEFWMAYSDFLKEFDKVEICYLSLSEAFSGDNFQWRYAQFSGRWTAGSNAGGRLKSKQFWTNPKFRIKLEHPNKEGGRDCTLVIALMQKGQRRKKPLGVKFTSMGFYIFKVSGDEELDKTFFKKNKPVAKQDRFRKMREVADMFKLPPGEYVIVPATKKEGKSLGFCLRIFARKPFEAEEVGKVVKADPFEPDVNASPANEAEFKDLDESSEYDAKEVKKYLGRWLSRKYSDVSHEAFVKELAELLMKLEDLDNTNTLSTRELKSSWMKVSRYTDIFYSVDADKTGTIDSHELKDAMKQAGFAIHDKVLEIIVQQYTNKNNLTLSFHDFLSCMIQLETLIKMFKLLETDEKGVITLSLDKWIRIGLAISKMRS